MRRSESPPLINPTFSRGGYSLGDPLPPSGAACSAPPPPLWTWCAPPAFISICKYNNLVNPGNSLDVSNTFPSYAFPLRFRCVSVRVFPLRFRLANARPTETAPTTRSALCWVWTRAAEQIRSQASFCTGVSTSSRNLRSRVRSRGSTFSGGLPVAATLGATCNSGPRVALTRMRLNVFPAASENPKVTLGSRWLECVPTFPSRFCQRFRHVSVNVSVTFPLSRCVPDGIYPETLPAFPGPIYIM